MELLRRICAILMLASIVLPQRSCIVDGKTKIYYPLSESGDIWEIIFVVILYALPVVLLFLTRYRITSLVSSIVVGCLGLFYQSYMPYVHSDHVLIGWWSYSVSTIGFVVTSVLLLIAALRRHRPQQDSMEP